MLSLLPIYFNRIGWLKGITCDVTQHMPELVGWGYGAEELPGRLHAVRYEIENAVFMRKSNENVCKPCCRPGLSVPVLCEHGTRDVSSTPVTR